MLMRIIEQLDRVYYGRDNFAVLSIKLVQHDLVPAQVADIPLSNGRSSQVCSYYHFPT